MNQQRPPAQQPVNIIFDAEMRPRFVNGCEVAFDGTQFIINFFSTFPGPAGGGMLRHELGYVLMRPTMAKQLSGLLADKIQQCETQYPDAFQDPKPSPLYIPPGAGRITTPD